MCSLPPPPKEPSLHPVDIGFRSEGAILGALIERGYSVLVPFGVNQRYDLVIDCEGQLLKAQCKTGRLKDGVVRFSARSVRSNTKRAVFRDYAGEVDLFLIFCPETAKTYALPIEEATRTTGALRVAATRNNQAQRIRWASDYELPA